MAAGPRYTAEAAGADRLPTIRRGPAGGAPLVVFVQPLFEEHNRCRRLFADIGRALAGRGIESALPDLPATGDHQDLTPFSFARAKAALAAFVAAQPGRPLLISVRGGALLTPEDTAHLAISAVAEGNRLLTDLIRAHSAGQRETVGKPFRRADADALWQAGKSCHLAGYEVTAETAFALRTEAASTPTRSIAMSGRNADIEGPPVWRQADPEDTKAAAAEIAERAAVLIAETGLAP